MKKIGTGYDVHKLSQGRDLILGGVNIDYQINGEKWGLIAHSDGDVLTHAIMDALLGAASLGDIGDHFPDTDAAYKNINSMDLLKKVDKLITELGYSIMNIDATLILQAPKVSPYKMEMKRNISNILNIDLEKVNIKATTEEGLGFTGRGEGIAAQAVTLLTSEKQ